MLSDSWWIIINWLFVCSNWACQPSESSSDHYQSFSITQIVSELRKWWNILDSRPEPPLMISPELSHRKWDLFDHREYLSWNMNDCKNCTYSKTKVWKSSHTESFFEFFGSQAEEQRHRRRNTLTLQVCRGFTANRNVFIQALFVLNVWHLSLMELGQIRDGQYKDIMLYLDMRLYWILFYRDKLHLKWSHVIFSTYQTVRLVLILDFTQSVYHSTDDNWSGTELCSDFLKVPIVILLSHQRDLGKKTCKVWFCLPVWH